MSQPQDQQLTKHPCPSGGSDNMLVVLAL